MCKNSEFMRRTDIHAERQPRATYALADTPQAVSHVIARGPEQHIPSIVQQRKQMIPTPVARQKHKKGGESEKTHRRDVRR